MFPPFSRPRRVRAFTLVEVVIALGIMAFALVAIIGVMPLALSTERISFDEGRAAAVATTLFGIFRGQPFTNVLYLDASYDPSTGVAQPGAVGINLTTVAVPPPTATPISLYATYLSAASDQVSQDAIGDQRRLCFAANPPTTGADYQLALYFTLPAGLFPVNAQVRQAIQMEVVVTPIHRSQSSYHFVSTITNTSN